MTRPLFRSPLRRAAAIAFVSLLVTGLPAQAGGLEDHARIRALAEQHALGIAHTRAPGEAHVRAQASRLDPRLRLAACPELPETFSPPGHRPGAHLSVGVRCPAAGGWSLYVPVRIEVLMDVLVLAAPVGRGEVLGEADLRLETRDVAQITGAYLTRAEDATGMVLRRPVQPGVVLTTTTIEAPTIVTRGQRVRVESGRGGFVVASEGEAMSDAAAGDRLRVRNLRSRQIVEGTVTDDGRVYTGT